VTRVLGVGEGNRIPARRPERPATQQAADREPQAPPRAMNFKGLKGVTATRRGEATRRRPAFHGVLIGQHGPDQGRNRASNWCRSNWSSTDDRDAASGAAPNRYVPGGRSDSEAARCNMTLSCRRTRLRTTAGPRARPSANATHGGVVVSEGSRMNVHHRTPARARRPSRAKRVNALRSRIRQIKPTGGAGPCRAEP